MKKKIYNISRGITAGFIAITVNTLLLKSADLFHIKAEGGGLLKLLIGGTQELSWLQPLLQRTWFPLAFHYLTGFFMVGIYVYVSPVFSLPGWVKGSLFSIFPWILNGVIVLPALNQGILGFNTLSLSGILYFFLANGIFGLLLGWIYGARQKGEDLAG